MCCITTLKIILSVFSTVIWLAGAIVILMGVSIVKDSSYLEDLLSHSQDPYPDLRPLARTGYVLLAMGAGLTFTGLLGCWECLGRNKCILTTFFFTVLVVFLTVVSGAVFIVVFQPVVKGLLDEISDKVVNGIRSAYGETDIFTSALDKAMDLKKCCGYNNYEDFIHTKFVKENSLYPKNCCYRGQPEICTLQAAKSAEVKGCFNALLKLVEEKPALLGGVAICVAVLEVGAVAMFFTLYRTRTTSVTSMSDRKKRYRTHFLDAM